jgi:hypothetical protein
VLSDEEWEEIDKQWRKSFHRYDMPERWA